MRTAQVPLPLPTPLPFFSHSPPAHALMGLPLVALAFSVTLELLGKRALQPGWADPGVNVHAMPAGDEVTDPPPPAPRCTVRT
jgi:hypothetical protein